MDRLRILPMLETMHTAEFAGIVTAFAVRYLHIIVHNKGLLALAESVERRMVAQNETHSTLFLPLVEISIVGK